MFKFSPLANHFDLWTQTNCPQLVLILDMEEQRRDIRHTIRLATQLALKTCLGSATITQHAIADLHMLAAKIVSTCPPLIPRYSVSFLLIVWSRQFHQLHLWITGLRTDLSLDRVFWVTRKRLSPQHQAVSHTKIVQLYASNKHLSKIQGRLVQIRMQSSWRDHRGLSYGLHDIWTMTHFKR